MTSQRTSYAFVCLLLLLSLDCKEHIADAPQGNQSPRTFLWLYPERDLNTGVSRQRLHWWGEDPDGSVVGFLFAFSTAPEGPAAVPVPDSLRYTWTVKSDSLVSFPLDTLFKKFLVVVRGVDNRFPGLPEQSIVRLAPYAYWDKNDNGMFDGLDQTLPGLSGSMDLKGAVQTFPVRNTPPGIAFLPNPNDPTLALRQPDTTYTVATFGFKGFDFDGDNTLSAYRIALNDTATASNWLQLGLRDTVVTLVVPRARSDAAGAVVTADVYAGSFLGSRLVGQINGLRLDALNVFYVQVRDLAGEYSKPIRLPSGTDTWYVKRPRGKLLLVSDYINSDAPTALGTYLSALASVPGGQFTLVDRLNIAQGMDFTAKATGKFSTAVPPFIDPALINTFLLFDYVFWYTDQFPSLGVAQLSLFNCIQKGGKILFSTSFLNTTDPRGALRDFAPIDSISSVNLSPLREFPPAYAGDSQIPGNFIVFADSSVPSKIYPQLAFNGDQFVHSVFMRPVYKRSDARYLYHLQADSRVPTRYYGTPNLGVVDGQSRIIFMGVPLHILDNRTFGNLQGLGAFFTRIVTQEFSPSQRVNRARY